MSYSSLQQSFLFYPPAQRVADPLLPHFGISTFPHAAQRSAMQSCEQRLVTSSSEFSESTALRNVSMRTLLLRRISRDDNAASSIAARRTRSISVVSGPLQTVATTILHLQCRLHQKRGHGPFLLQLGPQRQPLEHGETLPRLYPSCQLNPPPALTNCFPPAVSQSLLSTLP